MYDFSLQSVLKGPDGKVLRDMAHDDDGKETGLVNLTAGAFIYKVLDTPREGDQKLSPNEIYKLGALAYRINQDMATKVVVSKFTKDEITLIQNRLPGFATRAVFALMLLLDPVEGQRLGVGTSAKEVAPEFTPAKEVTDTAAN